MESSFLNLERICHELFESAAEGLLVVGSEGQILLANPRIKELFGYKPGEILGKPVEMLIPQKSRTEHKTLRKKYYKDPHKRSMGAGLDLSGLRKDGTLFPVEISLNHFVIEREKFIMALITDISTRKKAEDRVHQLNEELEKKVEERTFELKESQKFHSLIARNFPNGTINVFDRNFNYIFVEGKELFKRGITSEKLVGTNYIKRLPEEIRDFTSKNLSEVFDGKNKNFEIKFKNNHYILNAVPLEGIYGKIEQILVVEMNVTQRKKAEEEIQKALLKEKQLNELKSRFVSMASHEFRTPLGTILSSVALLEKYTDQGNLTKRKKHVLRIRTAVHNLTGILNDFLSLDKLEQGKLEFHPIQFNITEFSKEIIEEMQEMAKEKQLVLYEHIGKISVLHQDKQVFKNIAVNLLSNAIKYSSEGKNIEFTTLLEKSHLVLTIKDFGIGIPEEDQVHLFERFFRAKNSSTIEGTGLGLNIVKKYVDLLGGKISFQSKENEGTTFIVDIPIK